MNIMLLFRFETMDNILNWLKSRMHPMFDPSGAFWEIYSNYDLKKLDGIVKTAEVIEMHINENAKSEVALSAEILSWLQNRQGKKDPTGEFRSMYNSHSLSADSKDEELAKEMASRIIIMRQFYGIDWSKKVSGQKTKASKTKRKGPVVIPEATTLAQTQKPRTVSLKSKRKGPVASSAAPSKTTPAASLKSKRKGPVVSPLAVAAQLTQLKYVPLNGPTGASTSDFKTGVKSSTLKNRKKSPKTKKRLSTGTSNAASPRKKTAIEKSLPQKKKVSENDKSENNVVSLPGAGCSVTLSSPADGIAKVYGSPTRYPLSPSRTPNGTRIQTQRYPTYRDLLDCFNHTQIQQDLFFRDVASKLGEIRAMKLCAILNYLKTRNPHLDPTGEIDWIAHLLPKGMTIYRTGFQLEQVLFSLREKWGHNWAQESYSSGNLGVLVGETIMLIKSLHHGPEDPFAFNFSMGGLTAAYVSPSPPNSATARRYSAEERRNYNRRLLPTESPLARIYHSGVSSPGF